MDLNAHIMLTVAISGVYWLMSRQIVCWVLGGGVSWAGRAWHKRPACMMNHHHHHPPTLPRVVSSLSSRCHHIHNTWKKYLYEAFIFCNNTIMTKIRVHTYQVYFSAYIITAPNIYIKCDHVCSMYIIYNVCVAYGTTKEGWNAGNRIWMKETPVICVTTIRTHNTYIPGIATVNSLTISTGHYIWFQRTINSCIKLHTYDHSGHKYKHHLAFKYMPPTSLIFPPSQVGASLQHHNTTTKKVKLLASPRVITYHTLCENM